MSEADQSPDMVVSKGEFSKLCNVTPGRVSQWISEGKITGDALVGEGRNAKVRVVLALAQLKLRLDISQRFGNGLSTNLNNPVAAPAQATVTPPLQVAAPVSADVPLFQPAAPRPPVADPVEEKIKRERLEQIARANRKAAEEEEARAGRFVETASSQKQMGNIAAAMLQVFEGGLAEIAQAISARFAVPQRDVLHLLHGEFRKVRQSAHEVYQRQGETMPELVEVDLPEFDLSEPAPSVSSALAELEPCL